MRNGQLKNNQFKLNGALIKKTLKYEGRNLTWIIRHVGISRSLVDQMMAGKIPSESVLQGLADLLGCKSSDLLLPKKK